MTHTTQTDNSRYSDPPPSAGLAQSYYQASEPPNSPLPPYSDPQNIGYQAEAMHYAKPVDEASKSTDSQSTALLKQDPERLELPEGGPFRHKCKKTRLTHKNSHVRGKQYLALLRIYISPCTTVLALVSAINMAIAYFGIYQEGAHLSTEPTNRSQQRLYAFPQTLETLPETIIFSVGLAATVYNTAILFMPICRSQRRFYNWRYSIPEILEVIGHIAIIAAGAAGLYFAFTAKPDVEKSLWGFTCSRTDKPEPIAFPNVRYTNACKDYSVAVYTLAAALGFAALNVITYTVNVCLKRRFGVYIESDDSLCMDACECCGSCCSAIADFFIWFQCCFACFDLCS
ncbi:hypothetical protein Dda_3724 [Drechslerella dactyloides]|uniref:Uncharacterized protein n=1 Tax=Drechslerella dactyloides TaxID=74499 RepID=A0AAD6IYF5_DREDA|nr:hypothetical protein Dda_3724 [Drechslerella dactyloides]